MKKVKLLNTGEVIEVTPNVAFGLVEAGKATYDLDMYVPSQASGKMEPKPAPKNKKEAKQMEADRERSRLFYKNRMMTSESKVK